MSVNMTLQKTADEFDKILSILEKADPKLIASAAIEVRKQIKLNADEEAKLAEAKAFMINYEKIKTEVELNQKQNAQDKAANDAESLRLSQLDKKLKTKAARLIAAGQEDD